MPVERVRVDEETVTSEQQVDEEVRKKQIELDENPAGSAQDPNTDTRLN